MPLVGKNSIQKTYYEVLSVKEDASFYEIRASYRVALLKTHPDKLLMNPKAVEPHHELQARFLDLQKAWEVLCDPKSRANYDRELRASRQELVVTADEIKLGEMAVDTVGDVHELLYECRCGDHFSITSLELAEIGISLDGGLGVGASPDLAPVSVVLPCGSCSLKVRLVIDAAC